MVQSPLPSKPKCIAFIFRPYVSLFSPKYRCRSPPHPKFAAALYLSHNVEPPTPALHNLADAFPTLILSIRRSHSLSTSCSSNEAAAAFLLGQPSFAVVTTIIEALADVGKASVTTIESVVRASDLPISILKGGWRIQSSRRDMAEERLQISHQIPIHGVALRMVTEVAASSEAAAPILWW